VHNVIFNELCVGQLIPKSKEGLKEIILALQRDGANAVVLACTELPLIIRSEDTPVRLFDTLSLHVHKVVTLALET
jgi:aspartate racemase